MGGKNEVYDLCTFKGCINEVWTFGKSLFPFPHIESPRSEIWLENCGNKSILSRSEISLRKLGLCSDHFSPDSFYDEGKKKLREDAVPEPYSPTFKRLNPLTRVNTRIYDHNYALAPHDVDKTLEATYKRELLYPLRSCNIKRRIGAPAPSQLAGRIKSQGSSVPKARLSPRVKRDSPCARNKSNTVTKVETKASASIEVGANSAVTVAENVSSNRRSRRVAVGKARGNNAGVVAKDKEVGILQETNNELKTQNKLLRKLNGQLKLKVKRSEDRNLMLKTMLEKACSVDGFLDLHRCTKLAVRNLIKDEIYKCKTPTSVKKK